MGKAPSFGAKRSIDTRRQRISPTPALFWQSPTQRLLAALAWKGTMVTSHAMAAANFYNRFAFPTLEAAGLIVRWKRHSKRSYVALNEGHPAMPQMKALLKYLVPLDSLQVSTRKREIIETAPRKRVPAKALENVLGWPGRVRFFCLLAALGGRSERAALARGLADMWPDVFRNIIHAFTYLGCISEENCGNQRYITFNTSTRVGKALRALSRKLLNAGLDYTDRVSASRARPPTETYKPYERVPYLHGAYGALKPQGFSPPASGTPLLFGTDARYRVMVALAVCGPMRIGELQKAARVLSEQTVRTLEKYGFLIREGSYHKRFAVLNSSFPANDELRTLLRKMHRHYTVIETSRKHTNQSKAARSKPWTGQLEKLCGTNLRTKVLISVGAADGIDVSSLSRLFPEHATIDLLQAAHMFTAFGVFERHAEGCAWLYYLAPKFVAYRELRGFIRRLVKIWPQYKTRVDSAERYMSPRRLAMRRNSRRKKISLKSEFQ